MFHFYRIISEIADIKVMGILMALLIVTLYLKGYAKDSYKIAGAGVLAMFITYSLKYLLKVPRPLEMLVMEDGYRFPSGHATLAGVVMALGIYYAHMYVKRGLLRNAFYLLSVLWFVTVSYSRLYLGVHIPVDVIAGGVIGVASTLLVFRVFKHLHYYKR